jgi:hypothetical protein
MKNKQTLYHFVLDRSGSMSNCITSTINGFNAQLETIKSLKQEFPEQEFYVSLTVFDDTVNTIYSQVGINDFQLLTRSNYHPNGSTALLDAIGISINEIRIKNESKIIADEMSVVVVILTDGMENASRQFNYHQIAATIKSLEETERWTFTFLGADIDAIHTSKMLNIREENVISFNKGDMNNMMNDISEGMRQYSFSKSEGKTKKDFLDFIQNKDKRK